MANVDQIPLNTFRLITQGLSAGPSTIYTPDPLKSITTVVLSIQIANNSTTLQPVTAEITRPTPLKSVCLLKGYEIPPKDALNPIIGKLILETSDTLVVTAESTDLDATVSILETAKE